MSRRPPPIPPPPPDRIEHRGGDPIGMLLMVAILIVLIESVVRYIWK